MKLPPTKVVLTVGIPGCGKSTWANKTVQEGNGQWVRINKDELRTMLHADKWSKEREALTEDVRDNLMIECLRLGKNVIIDDTNLARRHVERVKTVVEGMKKFMPNLNCTIEEHWFNDSLDFGLCMKRNQSRTRTVPNDVMEQMFRSFMKRYIEEQMP